MLVKRSTKFRPIIEEVFKVLKVLRQACPGPRRRVRDERHAGDSVEHFHNLPLRPSLRPGKRSAIAASGTFFNAEFFAGFAGPVRL
jgi:hypothetical protein